jgi:hypothetical protein
MYASHAADAPRLRIGLILWLTALLLAALDVQPLNPPEPRPAAPAAQAPLP